MCVPIAEKGRAQRLEPYDHAPSRKCVDGDFGVSRAKGELEALSEWLADDMSWTLIEKSTHSGPSAPREVRPPFSRAGGGHFCRHPRTTRFLRRLPRGWRNARPFQPCVPLRQHPQDLDDRRTATLLHRDAG